LTEAKSNAILRNNTRGSVQCTWGSKWALLLVITKENLAISVKSYPPAGGGQYRGNPTFYWRDTVETTRRAPVTQQDDDIVRHFG